MIGLSYEVTVRIPHNHVVIYNLLFTLQKEYQNCCVMTSSDKMKTTGSHLVYRRLDIHSIFLILMTHLVLVHNMCPYIRMFFRVATMQQLARALASLVLTNDKSTTTHNRRGCNTQQIEKKGEKRFLLKTLFFFSLVVPLSCGFR